MCLFAGIAAGLMCCIAGSLVTDQIVENTQAYKREMKDDDAKGRIRL